MAPIRSKGLWLTVLGSVTVALSACSHAELQPIASTSSTASSSAAVATNTAGRPAITYDPCKEIPASLIAQLKLDKLPPEPTRQSDGETENNMCGYLSQARIGVTVAASNYTLEMDKKDSDHADFKDFEVNGRKALSYYLFQNDTKTCAIDLEATTGLYGVKVDSALGGFGDYPDCLTAARAYLDAFLPYFPA